MSNLRKINIKVAFPVILFFLLSFFLTHSSAQTEEGWFEFVIPTQLPKDSPVNIGSLVLDPPAGKHGFIKVDEDGHLYFYNDEDEIRTPAKFWGININSQSGFPSHEEARIMADRIAFFGFNAVHLQAVDRDFEPIGVFKDEPYTCDPQLKTTQDLSTKQLDRLDYLIAQLKERGIYIYLDLLVRRKFTLEDGVIGADEFDYSYGSGAGKPASLFDPRMIYLQKEYAGKYLDRINIYTGKAYNDEPALIIVEVTNENSLFHAMRNYQLDLEGSPIVSKYTPLPLYYIEMLTSNWNDWLKEKYVTVEAVAQAWDTGVFLPEELLNDPGNLDSWMQNVYSDDKHPAQATFTNTGPGKNDPFKIDITKSSVDPWRVNLRQGGINLLNNNKYLAKFEAKSDGGDIALSITKDGGEWNNRYFSEKMNLESGYQEYSYVYAFDYSYIYTPEDSFIYTPSRLSFNMGHRTQTVFLKGISLKKYEPISVTNNEILSGNFNFIRPGYAKRILYPKARIDDLYEFYMDTEIAYVVEMRNYLKNELEIQALISGNNNYYSLASIKAQTYGDFISDHAYWDHPLWRDPFRLDFSSMKLRSMFYGLDNISIRNGDIYQNLKDNPVTCLATSRVNGKPFIVSEWNHVYPNPYPYEMPVIMAAYSNFLEFDGLFVHTLRAKTNTTPERSPLDPFTVNQDPLKMSLNAQGGLIYLKGMVEPAKETVTLPYSNADIFNNLDTFNTKRTFGDKYNFAPFFGNKEIFHPFTVLSHKFDNIFSSAGLPDNIPELENSNLISSDTSQLEWDRLGSIFTVNTDYVQGATGSLGNQPITLDNLIVSARSVTNGSILLLPLDQNTSLDNSEKILLYAVSEIKNTGSGWYTDTEGAEIYSWGKWPPLLKKMDMSVTVTTGAEGFRVFALDSHGLPVREIPSENNGGANTFIYSQDTVWCLLNETASR